VKLIYTKHALSRALTRLLNKKETECNPLLMSRAKLLLDKLIITPAFVLPDKSRVYLKIDSFDDFTAVGIIENGEIVIKTISPIT
jgi:hypothetical protein